MRGMLSVVAGSVLVCSASAQRYVGYLDTESAGTSFVVSDNITLLGDRAAVLEPGVFGLNPAFTTFRRGVNTDHWIRDLFGSLRGGGLLTEEYVFIRDDFDVLVGTVDEFFDGVSINDLPLSPAPPDHRVTAFAASGDSLLVSGPLNGGPDHVYGTTMISLGTDGTWDLHPLDNGEASPTFYFGERANVRGDVAVIPGTRRPSDLWVYRRDGDVWALETRLRQFMDPDAPPNVWEGFPALDEGVVVSATTVFGEGAAIDIFTRTETGWSYERLFPRETLVFEVEDVAIEDGRLAVLTRDSVWNRAITVYEETPAGWEVLHVFEDLLPYFDAPPTSVQLIDGLLYTFIFGVHQEIYAIWDLDQPPRRMIGPDQVLRSTDPDERGFGQHLTYEHGELWMNTDELTQIKRYARVDGEWTSIGDIPLPWAVRDFRRASLDQAFVRHLGDPRGIAVLRRTDGEWVIGEQIEETASFDAAEDRVIAKGLDEIRVHAYDGDGWSTEVIAGPWRSAILDGDTILATTSDGLRAIVPDGVGGWVIEVIDDSDTRGLRRNGDVMVGSFSFNTHAGYSRAYRRSGDAWEVHGEFLFPHRLGARSRLIDENICILCGDKSVFVYQFDGTEWMEAAAFRPEFATPTFLDPLADFGRHIEYADGTLIVSAEEAPLDGEDDIGVVYLYNIDCDQDGVVDAYEIGFDPTLDLNDDLKIDNCQCLCDVAGEPTDVPGTVTIVDLLAYLDWWLDNDSAAEMVGDGVVNIVDLLAFLDCWLGTTNGADCP